MLFLLTGEIQTGKTRWLEAVVARLVDAGVRVDGVLAPGVWVEHFADGSESDDPDIEREKIGIDNVLLPQDERIRFARRRDIAERAGNYDEGSQSAAMQLGWAIDDGAIAQVNAHFYTLAGGDFQKPGLLVVDELGRLELENGAGFTTALELLDRGATAVHPHSLIVVRAGLVDAARNRLADVPWGGMQVITPSQEGERMLRAAFGI